MDRPTVATAAMAAVVRRLAMSAHRELFVLRGGLVTAALVAPHPRLVEDVDLLARVERFDAEVLGAALFDVLDTDAGDGVVFGAARTEIIWADTPFPGLRVEVPVDGVALQIDIGAGDPMHGGPVEREIAGARVWTCRAETMLGWKLHGMVERGPGRWRPKDLHDLDLLLARPLEAWLVAPSISLAFASRGDALGLADRLVAGELGQSSWSLRKWQRFRDDPRAVCDPGPLDETVARVSAALRRYLSP